MLIAVIAAVIGAGIAYRAIVGPVPEWEQIENKAHFLAGFRSLPPVDMFVSRERNPDKQRQWIAAHARALQIIAGRAKAPTWGEAAQ